MSTIRPYYKMSAEFKIGKYARALQFLSRIYILPITINYRKKQFNFAFFSFQFMISFLISSIPFWCTVAWFAYQPDYCYALYRAFKQVYVTSDLLMMIFFPGIYILPFSFSFTSIVLPPRKGSKNNSHKNQCH